MNEPINRSSNGAISPMPTGQTNVPTITIEQLAAKVYQLMMEDARLARARGDSITRARK